MYSERQQTPAYFSIGGEGMAGAEKHDIWVIK